MMFVYEGYIQFPRSWMPADVENDNLYPENYHFRPTKQALAALKDLLNQSDSYFGMPNPLYKEPTTNTPIHTVEVKLLRDVKTGRFIKVQ